jgi:hypothetical protein
MAIGKAAGFTATDDGGDVNRKCRKPMTNLPPGFPPPGYEEGVRRMHDTSPRLWAVLGVLMLIAVVVVIVVAVLHGGQPVRVSPTPNPLQGSCNPLQKGSPCS